MKTKNIGLKNLLSGSFIIFIILAAISQAGAQSCVPPASGLISWWPADGNANDIAGGNDRDADERRYVCHWQGSQAFSLDGIDDFVHVAHHPSLNPAHGLTIEAWGSHSASLMMDRV